MSGKNVKIHRIELNTEIIDILSSFGGSIHGSNTPLIFHTQFYTMIYIYIYICDDIWMNKIIIRCQQIESKMNKTENWLPFEFGAEKSFGLCQFVLYSVLTHSPERPLLSSNSLPCPSISAIS